MLRLFLRFYLSVLFILVAAWAIQTYVVQRHDATQGMRIIEEVVGGGARLAREVLEHNQDRESRDRELAHLNSLFDYQVSIHPVELAPRFARKRIEQGDDVVAIAFEDKLIFGTPLHNGNEILVFGTCPLAVVEGPSHLRLIVGLGGVLLLAAVAIAVQLRPVAMQLYAMERVARVLAGGDLRVRVDVKELKAAATLAQAFNTMADRTELMLRSQRELLQAVSHELRTPLSRMHFAIDLLRSAVNGQERVQRLNSLDAAVNELDELVNELLEYVRIETGQQPLEIVDVPMRSLVRELIEELSLVYPQKQFEIGEDLRAADVTLVADRRQLRRALGNVLGNAGRFAESRIVINASQDTDGIRIEVDDDGPGIREADRSRIFEPFVRCDETGGGTGLGLTLVQRIVNRHGGSVSASESPLGGARLRIDWRPYPTANGG